MCLLFQPTGGAAVYMAESRSVAQAGVQWRNLGYGNLWLPGSSDSPASASKPEPFSPTQQVSQVSSAMCLLTKSTTSSTIIVIFNQYLIYCFHCVITDVTKKRVHFLPSTPIPGPLILKVTPGQRTRGPGQSLRSGCEPGLESQSTYLLRAEPAKLGCSEAGDEETEQQGISILIRAGSVDIEGPTYPSPIKTDWYSP
ncbi:hypothetical protein AAY473_012617 [Plecturocebus cupreus]